MRILVTGATGYVGSRVAARLVARGDTVTGLAREAGRVAALPPGISPVVADLADAAAIVALAADHDAVVHTGFAAHGRDWPAAVEVERALVSALAEALRGTGKRLVVSNGTGFYRDAGGAFLDETETPPSGHPAAIRHAATRPAWATPGLDGIELRLASFVHGYGGSVFLPILVAHACATGRSLFVGDGANRVSAVHVDAAADAYVAALAPGAPAGVYHIASDDAPPMRDLAEAIAIGVGAKATAATAAEAAAALDPFTAMFLALDNGLASGKARRALDWSPAGAPGLLWDVAHGSYAAR